MYKLSTQRDWIAREIRPAYFEHCVKLTHARALHCVGLPGAIPGAALVDTVRGMFIYSRRRRLVSQLILDKQGANFSLRDGAPGSDKLSLSLFLTDHHQHIMQFKAFNLGVPLHLPSSCHLNSECASSLCLSF